MWNEEIHMEHTILKVLIQFSEHLLNTFCILGPLLGPGLGL